MPSFTDIPVELIIDNLLPLLSLKDILSLTVVNKGLSVICSDDTLWKRKVKEDYNFSDSSSARTKGYKFLYRGIHNSQVYVWGQSSDGRLGMEIPFSKNIPILHGGIACPKQLQIPGVRLIDIVAGGWSFHGLDSSGNVYVWGTLNTENHALMSDPVSISGRSVRTPVKLLLPERISKISCGRAHSMGLTESNRVLVFTNWGTPWYLASEVISPSSSFSTPIQVECGWSFSAVLTRGGEVYVFWPNQGLFRTVIREHAIQTEDRARQGQRIDIGHGDTVGCVLWEITTDPYALREVDDDLPKLHPDTPSDHTRIVKIAAGDNFLIGLTRGGHVLKVDFPGQSENFTGPAMSRPRWTYLPQFSEMQIIQELPALNKEITCPSSSKMTHISAHFKTFFAYSTGSPSIVLRGSADTITTPPDIIPGLQNRDIIGVVVGDYHYAALTSTGKLLTWGQYSAGALGLGDPRKLVIGTPGGYATERARSTARIPPPSVSIPTEVKFGTTDYGKGRNVFVFGVTACGWHTGALIIDLDDPEHEEPEEEYTPSTGPHNDVHEPGALPGLFPGPPFRVGFGVGRRRGRGT